MPVEYYPGQFAKWQPMAYLTPNLADAGVIMAMACPEVRALLLKKGKMDTAAASIMATTYILEIAP